jgi:uncharacterized protein (TIGR02594 family)
MTIEEIQRRLKSLGYAAGPVDGIAGRLTRRAIVSFQRDSSLRADGIAGRDTLAALFPSVESGSVAAADVALPWLEEAKRWQGLREVAGPGSNKTIVAWGRAVADWFADDDIPWCGAFVHGVLASAMPDEPLPANALWARGWLRFGTTIAPTPGAILVFWRGTRSGSSGHVGFYAGEDGAAFHVLGGNQSNAVTIARIAKHRLLGARWPRTAPLPTAKRQLRQAAGSLSTNEA